MLHGCMSVWRRVCSAIEIAATKPQSRPTPTGFSRRSACPELAKERLRALVGAVLTAVAPKLAYAHAALRRPAVSPLRSWEYNVL